MARTIECQLLESLRSTSYYWPERVSESELGLMRVIDEIRLRSSWFTG